MEIPAITGLINCVGEVSVYQRIKEIGIFKK